jgi:predicted short-subunit dehydrogenase-like oxidoreductase (DUF2520 family)
VSRGIFELGRVLNRSLQSARRAVAFVGAGAAVEQYDQLAPADLFMISTRDDAIAECGRRLSLSGVLREGNVVFHCSGALPSTLLAPARQRGACVASLHPVKSFADSAHAAATFAGTLCALEGDPQACAVLGEAVRACGAETFDMRPESKTVYHAATVFSCNYLVALIELGLQCFEQAAVPRETAESVLEPIVRDTVNNVFQLGTVQSLTGPIARGESSLVKKQLEALEQWNPDVAHAYRVLGRAALGLAAAQATAPAGTLAEIEKALQ